MPDFSFFFALTTASYTPSSSPGGSILARSAVDKCQCTLSVTDEAKSPNPPAPSRPSGQQFLSQYNMYFCQRPERSAQLLLAVAVRPCGIKEIHPAVKRHMNQLHGTVHVNPLNRKCAKAIFVCNNSSISLVLQLPQYVPPVLSILQMLCKRSVHEVLI